jgi:cell division protein FtsA
VAALDIGSTKVCCLIGEVAPAKRKLPGGPEHDELTVIGIGHQASRGVHCGAVVDLDEAERAIRLAVDAAERMAGRPSRRCSSTFPAAARAAPRTAPAFVCRPGRDRR